jgi:hypothetical protein
VVGGKAALVQAAMKLKPDSLDALHRQRLAEIRRKAEEKLRKARERGAEKKKKDAEQKAELLRKLSAVGGLWESEEHVETALEHVQLPTADEGEKGGDLDRATKRLEAAQLEAVKDQLRFRKHVLLQTYTDVDIQFSAAGKELGLEVMKGKLLALLVALRRAPERPGAPERTELRPAAQRAENLRAEKEKLAPEMVPDIEREREKREAKDRVERRKKMLILYSEAAAERRLRQKVVTIR